MKQRKIEEIEDILVSKKDWKYGGESRASGRKKNSLMDLDVDFETAIFNVPFSPEENTAIQRYINQRYREKTFDNYEFVEKKEKIVEEIYDVEVCETNKEIIALYEEIEKELKKLVDYGNDY